MESRENKDFDLYKDIQGRTGGEIYIGVVGPVRTGKSTFIKRFMDLFVLPYITDENTKKRAEDELPQSAAGKTIMTTEPKFIPQEAANITLADQSDIRVRLIDCVGFMVDGASGHMEGDNIVWSKHHGSRMKYRLLMLRGLVRRKSFGITPPSGSWLRQMVPLGNFRGKIT